MNVRVPHGGDRKVWAAMLSLLSLAVLCLSFFAPLAPPAHAAVQDSSPDPNGPEGVGLAVGNFSGGWMWFGTEKEFVDGEPTWCIQAGVPSAKGKPVVSVSTLSKATPHVSGWEMTTPQIAWLLDKYGHHLDSLTAAGISWLIHANLESPKTVRLVPVIEGYIRDNDPEIFTKAKALRAEAVKSAVVGYQVGSVSGEGARTGNIHSIGVTNDAGAYVAGIPLTVTLSGPAVFSSTGKATWTGTSSATPITLDWKATGNGTVTYTAKAKMTRTTLTRVDRGTGIQGTVTYGERPHADSTEVSKPGSSWRVVFSFRPQGVSSVGESKVVNVGEHLRDSLTANADPTFGDGQWIRQDDGSFVPVVFRANLYFVSPTQLPATHNTVAKDAALVRSVTVRATHPGQVLNADAGVAARPGFYTWVWEVRAQDQDNAVARRIDVGWHDAYGVAGETTSVRQKAHLDSALSIRSTKSGTFLVDDVWVSGLPEDHPGFSGGLGFHADTATIEERLLFFPENTEVSDENLSKAEHVGETVSVPARNGFYPSQGSTSWMVKTDTEGKAIPGTYVVVASFAGDDRVAALTTSTADTAEQFVVTPAPSIHTTLTGKAGRVPVVAEGTTTLTDTVAYTNLTPGKQYTLTGTLMDQATGKPLLGKDGNPLTATRPFTPHAANGTERVTFTVDAGLYAGHTTVAFETLTQDGREIAVHTDIQDENQALPFTQKLSTTAIDSADRNHVLEARPNQEVTDRVCMATRFFQSGHTYQITTTLKTATGHDVMDKDGKPVTVSTEFAPRQTGECAIIHIPFDATNLAAQKVVVFEDVSENGVILAVHHDLKDTNQTVSIAGTPETPRKLAHTGANLTRAGLTGAGIVVLGCAMTLAIQRRQSRTDSAIPNE
ncbi:MAG: VaFE repeat-containing surface-anchored protein [Actinomycetaceae bacterium]|nr:VaFE repeat-containing surface-anchored protein [Actinomycetaceae bacterium]MDY6082473.1 VaFE repeat-containing surface-anchored protein [Actinomycetaceae bacterium]